jgi:hypothetical protein
MRSIFLAPLLGLAAILFAACLNSPVDVEMTFVNRSDSSLCLYHSSNAPGIDACSEVKANARTVWTTGCGYAEEARSYPITVVLTLGEVGREIYSRTATCKEWQDADATFIIKQIGNEFIITDSLPSVARSP